tara:strand:- start:635 stop:886 length:252 start_codon:yes stop_codon:yes gene_type:complete
VGWDFFCHQCKLARYRQRIEADRRLLREKYALVLLELKSKIEIYPATEFDEADLTPAVSKYEWYLKRTMKALSKKCDLLLKRL